MSFAFGRFTFRPCFARFALCRFAVAVSWPTSSRLSASHACMVSALSDRPGGTVLWTIFAILLILWLLGWGFGVAGSFIHLLLIIAIIVAIISFITGRRTV